MVHSFLLKVIKLQNHRSNPEMYVPQKPEFSEQSFLQAEKILRL